MKAILKYKWSALTTLLIFVLSIVPVPEVPQLEGVTLFDKWVHIAMYAFLAIVIWWEAGRRPRPLSLRLFAMAVLFPITFGGAMELWQAYLTTCRSGDWLDFAANSVGVALALPIGLLIRRKS